MQTFLIYSTDLLPLIKQASKLEILTMRIVNFCLKSYSFKSDLYCFHAYTLFISFQISHNHNVFYHNNNKYLSAEARLTQNLHSCALILLGRACEIDIKIKF